MTNDHPTDDLDEQLRRAARDYNAPGSVPRDRMWAEIQARRAQRATAIPPLGTRRRSWYAPAVAAAVLVLGIAIGRVYERWNAQPNPKTVAAAPSTPVVIVAKAPDTAIANLDSQPAAPHENTINHASRGATRRGLPEPTPSDETNSRGTRSGGSMAYRLAVVEHLAGTEAMLTSFRAAAKRGEVDAQITTWARNLLTTTRLLQASAAQEDPTMKRLLDDLELVLVQIAQYTSAGPHRAEELELIEHSIERRGVIGKLHTNYPARATPAGT
jgi:hypothetical protein